MLLTKAGYQLVEHLERQDDMASLLAAFQRLVQSFGLDCFCLGDPAGPDRRWSNSAQVPAEWVAHYTSQKHLKHDPVVRHMNHGVTAFRWSDIRVTASARARRVLDEAAAFGLCDGFALGIHEGGRLIGGISVAARHYELNPQEEVSLQLAALYLHAKAARLPQAQVRPSPQPSLTPRERECLSWVASGKTDWEISQILSISEQTAHGYVQNAISKLKARTRAQAVAIAIQTRQIRL